MQNRRRSIVDPQNSEGLLIVLLLAVVVLMWVYRRANGGL